MTQKDIPRFTSAMMLVALGTLLKSNQSLKLVGDLKPAFSYLDSFLAFQPGQKDETDHINVPYLRNRAGDLNLWLSLPLLRQQGYPKLEEHIGEHRQIKADLGRLTQRVVEGADIDQELLGLIREWIIGHIGVEDVEFAKAFARKNA